MLRLANNVAFLQAHLDTCLNGGDYKKLSAREGLHVHSIVSQADKIVTRLEDAFDKSGSLGMQVSIWAQDYSEDKKFQKYFRENFHNQCDKKMLGWVRQKLVEADGDASMMIKKIGVR